MRYLAQKVNMRAISASATLVVLALATLIAIFCDLGMGVRAAGIAGRYLTVFTLAYVLILGVVGFENLRRAAVADPSEMEPREILAGECEGVLVMDDGED